MHSPMNVSLNSDLMQLTFSRNLDVSVDTAFPDPMLYNWSLGVSSENEFRDSWIVVMILSWSVQFLFIWFGLSSDTTLSFDAIPSSSNSFDKMLFRNEWLSANLSRAAIDFVIDCIPVRWLAASALIVYSSYVNRTSGKRFCSPFQRKIAPFEFCI